MGKSAATKQLDQANEDKKKYLGQIESFEYGQQRQGLDNPFADITNPFENLTNTFSNQRVATGAAEFQAQRNDENQAAILDAVVQGGGASGVNATALARQAQQGNQQIAANLQQQEQQIQQQAAQQGSQIQQLQAQGASRAQELIAGGEQYILGLSEQRDQAELAGLGNLYAGANESANAALKAKAQSKAAIIGAIGQLGGAALSAGTGGGGSIFGALTGLNK